MTPEPIATLHDADDSEWFTIAGKVTELTEEGIHEKKEQEGRIEDGTGSIKFTHWGNAPTLEKGKTYKLDGVVTNEYYGNITININKSTDVEECEETVIPDQIENKPRRTILENMRTVGPDSLPKPDRERNPVSINDINVDNPTKPLNHIEIMNWGTYSIPGFWEEIGYELNTLSYSKRGDYHIPKIYGVTPDGNLIVGCKGTTRETTREFDDVNEWNNIASTGNQKDGLTVKTEGEKRALALGKCENCDAQYTIKDVIGVNPFSPSEDYLSFYDWWKETERHNIDVPECPECGQKELMPPSFPKNISLTYEVDLGENPTIDDVNNVLSNWAEDEAWMSFTKQEILSLTGKDILAELPADIQEIGNVITKKPGVDRRYSDAWPRRYIELHFSRILTEEELNQVGDAVVKHDEGIHKVKDNDGKTIVVLSEHSV